ncbi:MAG TPA: YihY/virulence factor BrkB family protein [Caulobacteraceae bacterium]|nr:YihY/virulence factor BrkB family protein [Caulobacteraceae bacterium]
MTCRLQRSPQAHVPDKGLAPAALAAARWIARLRLPARWADPLLRTWREFNADNIVSVSGGVSFFAMMAVFPGMAAFVSLYGIFGDVEGARTHLAALAGLLPADALTFIGDEMVRIAAERQASLSLTFVLGALLSIWSANAGMKALMSGLNVAYEKTETRGFIRLNLVSLAFTGGALGALALAILGLVAVPAALEHVGLEPDLVLWGLLRWPILLLLAVTGLSTVYRFGPSRRGSRWRWITPGSGAGAAAWLGISLLFSWYAGHFARFSVTYGSLGAVIGFMTWIWLTVMVILAGGELNAELERPAAKDAP